LGKEDSSSGCLYDNLRRKAFKAPREEIAQEQLAQPYSFQNFLVPNPSTFALGLSFQAKILCVPFFCKLVDHFPGDWIFLFGPIELNDGI
jgi:hypothetical protein